MSYGIKGPYTNYSQILFTGQKMYTMQESFTGMEDIHSTTTTNDLMPLKLIPIMCRLPINSIFSKFPLACYIPNTELFSSAATFSVLVAPESDQLEGFRIRLLCPPPQFVVQQVWGQDQEIAFLKIFQEMLLIIGPEPPVLGELLYYL